MMMGNRHEEKGKRKTLIFEFLETHQSIRDLPGARGKTIGVLFLFLERERRGREEEPE